MIHEAHFLGFDVKLAGCGKEYLDPHQTPEGARRHCGDTQNPAKVCSFADGSKQSAELVSVANGFGLHPLRRGMHGPRVPKRDIVSTFERLAQLSRRDGGHVDYTLGSVEPDQGAPVFLIASHPQASGRADMRYLKKGEGPLYLFFRDHHLCHFEAASSVLEAVLSGSPPSHRWDASPTWWPWRSAISPPGDAWTGSGASTATGSSKAQGPSPPRGSCRWGWPSSRPSRTRSGRTTRFRAPRSMSRTTS